MVVERKGGNQSGKERLIEETVSVTGDSNENTLRALQDMTQELDRDGFSDPVKIQIFDGDEVVI